MDHDDFMERFDDILEEASELASRKNRDYGGEKAMDNLVDFGILGIIVRIGDKYHRAKNIVKSGRTHVADESLRDTLIDMLNYSAIAILMLDIEKEKKEDEV